MTTFEDVRTIMERPSQFGSDSSILMMGEYKAGKENMDKLHAAKVLVIGAGGLGCELLKDLALSGFRDIHVIDLDTIDVSNLNRQFLFRKKDVGRHKSHVASEFVEARVPGVKITPYTCPIQEKPLSFYRDFSLIVAGLDNLEARRWINNVVCSLVEFDDDGQPALDSIVPLIDGGSEGFKGQARVVVPHVTACFECSLDAFPPQRQFPMCTIASTPRKPEHCIAYASLVQWPEQFNRALDKDSPEDMRWVYERALERAGEFGIPGVTYFLTLGVVKSIIPAIASTNALVSAACVHEAVKVVTLAAPTLNSYFMYMGSQGLHTHTFPYGRKEECPVCGRPRAAYTMERSATLQDLVDRLVTDDSIIKDKFLKDPSLRTADVTLFMAHPPPLREATKDNLAKPLSELVESGAEVVVTDTELGNALSLIVTLTAGK